jgi:preprotein translocase subunit SecG
MFPFLLIVQTLVAVSLCGVILMQRSEGGGLGMGGSPSGLMSARGAADFLTRATTILAAAFILLSIGLAALATFQRGPRDIDTSLARKTAPVEQPAVPLAADPLAAAAAGAAANGPASGTDAIVPATPGTAGPATAPSKTAPSQRAEEPAAARPAAKPAERRAAPAATPRADAATPAASAAPAVPVVAPPAPAPAAEGGTNP